MFQDDPDTLCDILEGLFHIALADGFYHPSEAEFLHDVSQVFGQSEQQFQCLRSRFVSDAPRDAYEILGASPEQSFERIRSAWRRLVRDNHPDVMIARGVPEEAIKLAQKRMSDINRAWDDISQTHPRSPVYQE